MKKFILAIAVLSATVFSFSSCDSDQGEQVIVAAILKDGNIDYWQQIGLAIASKAASIGSGWFIAFVDSDGDMEDQLNALDTLKNLKGYKIAGLIVAPVYSGNDHRFEQAVADYSAENNVPVVLVDTPVDPDNSPLKGKYKCYVGTDNEAVGQELAKKISASAGNILTAYLGSSAPAVIRSESFHQEKGATAEWITSERQAEGQIDSVITANPDVTDYVFFNGGLCRQVLNKMEGRNVYTFDAYKETLKSLIDGGCVKGIMAQNTFGMGEAAVTAVFASGVPSSWHISQIYLDASSLYNDESTPFLNYFQISR